MAKANLKTVPTFQRESENPLVHHGYVNLSLDDMTAYAAFLCEYFARPETGEPGDELRHGAYLAMRVLHDALAVVGQRAETLKGEANHHG